MKHLVKSKIKQDQLRELNSRERAELKGHFPKDKAEPQCCNTNLGPFNYCLLSPLSSLFWELLQADILVMFLVPGKRFLFKPS